MIINILRYSLFGIAGGQEVGRTFVHVHTFVDRAFVCACPIVHA